MLCINWNLERVKRLRVQHLPYFCSLHRDTGNGGELTCSRLQRESLNVPKSSNPTSGLGFSNTLLGTKRNGQVARSFQELRAENVRATCLGRSCQPPSTRGHLALGPCLREEPCPPTLAEAEAAFGTLTPKLGDEV